MAEDLKELTKHVPTLMAALQKANLVPLNLSVASVSASTNPELDHKGKAREGNGTQGEVDRASGVEVKQPKEISETTTLGQQAMASMKEHRPDTEQHNSEILSPSSRSPEVPDPAKSQVE
jgi:hypothetical protein